MTGSGTCGKENGSDADNIYLRLCCTKGGGLAAYLILLVIAHAEAINRNERRFRTSEVLRPREIGTMTNWKGLKACEFNWCPPFRYVIKHMHLTLLEKTFVTSVKVVNTKSLRHSVMRW